MAAKQSIDFPDTTPHGSADASAGSSLSLPLSPSEKDQENPADVHVRAGTSDQEKGPGTCSVYGCERPKLTVKRGDRERPHSYPMCRQHFSEKQKARASRAQPPKPERVYALEGVRFGSLVADRPVTPAEAGRSSRRRGGFWRCQCDCGRVTYSTSSDLVRGSRISCGCSRTNARKVRTDIQEQTRDRLEFARLAKAKAMQDAAGNLAKIAKELGYT